MKINKNILKSIEEKMKEVTLVDLGSIPMFGGEFDGLKLPFKKKSFAEQLEIKSNVNFFDKKNVNVKTIPFRKMPRDIRELFDESNPSNRSGEPTYFRLIEMKDNKNLIDGIKIKERLLSFLLNIDMDYKFEEKTLWEEWEIKKGDYQALVKAFESVITSESLLESLEIIVEGLDKKIMVEVLPMYCSQRKYIKEIERIEDPIERENAMDELKKQIEEVQSSIKAKVSSKEVEENDK